jgi:uncharacterized protein
MKLKWTIHELIKKVRSENTFNITLDLSEYITTDFEDFVAISPTKVSGFFEVLEDNSLIIFNMHINTELTMLCSLTLKEVLVKLDFDTEIKFSTIYIDDDTHVIDGITIDLAPYVFSEIVIEKPMKVISKAAYKEYHEENFELPEEEVVENSPFAKIKIK